MAVSDYLLEIDGLKGETKDGKLVDCIEVDSFSWAPRTPNRSVRAAAAVPAKCR